MSAYDVRPAVKEEVESLGGRFVELELETGEGEGGYARAMDEAFYARQREMMLRVVARLKSRRRDTPRFAEEQAAIERWLGAVTRSLSRSPALALEVARCGQLIKGYGETRKRANRNFEAIYSTLIQPAADGEVVTHT